MPMTMPAPIASAFECSWRYVYKITAHQMTRLDEDRTLRAQPRRDPGEEDRAAHCDELDQQDEGEQEGRPRDALSPKSSWVMNVDDNAITAEIASENNRYAMR